MTCQLLTILEYEQALLAEVVPSREVNLGHVAGDDMFQWTAERAEATLEDTNDIYVAAEVLELRVDDSHFGNALLFTVRIRHHECGH